MVFKEASGQSARISSIGSSELDAGCQSPYIPAVVELQFRCSQCHTDSAVTSRDVASSVQPSLLFMGSRRYTPCTSGNKRPGQFRIVRAVTSRLTALPTSLAYEYQPPPLEGL